MQTVRIAVLADIHGNLPALEAVLDDASARGVDAWYCLGDVVGYGPDPVACLAHLRRLEAVCIQGNHEAAVLGLPTGPFNEWAKAAVLYCQQQLGPEEWDQIRAFPVQALPEPRVRLVHGSIFDRDEYLVALAQLRAARSVQEEWLVFGGHTHRGLVYDGEQVHDGEPSLDLDPQRRYLVNPGSVGQPRDGDPRAAWAWVDLRSGRLELRRVPYDLEIACTRFDQAGLPQRLRDRIRVGR